MASGLGKKNNTDIDAKLFTLVKCLLDSDNNSLLSEEMRAMLWSDSALKHFWRLMEWDSTLITSNSYWCSDQFLLKTTESST